MSYKKIVGDAFRIGTSRNFFFKQVRGRHAEGSSCFVNSDEDQHEHQGGDNYKRRPARGYLGNAPVAPDQN